MNEIHWDVTLPLIENEAEWLLKALDDYTDRNYNEIVSIVKQRLDEVIDEQKEEE